MSTLYRTQIYINEEQMRQLKLEAAKERISISALIRTAIARFLKTKAKRVKWKTDPLSHAIGKIKLTNADVSEKHDHYLYDTKK